MMNEILETAIVLIVIGVVFVAVYKFGTKHSKFLKEKINQIFEDLGGDNSENKSKAYGFILTLSTAILIASYILLASTIRYILKIAIDASSTPPYSILAIFSIFSILSIIILISNHVERTADPMIKKQQAVTETE